MRAEFTPLEIHRLRREFLRFNQISPESLPKFHAIFADAGDIAIAQLADAGIKFLSPLARNELRRRQPELAL